MQHLPHIPTGPFHIKMIVKVQFNRDFRGKTFFAATGIGTHDLLNLVFLPGHV